MAGLLQGVSSIVCRAQWIVAEACPRTGRAPLVMIRVVPDPAPGGLMLPTLKRRSKMPRYCAGLAEAVASLCRGSAYWVSRETVSEHPTCPIRLHQTVEQVLSIQRFRVRYQPPRLVHDSAPLDAGGVLRAGGVEAFIYITTGVSHRPVVLGVSVMAPMAGPTGLPAVSSAQSSAGFRA